jgi:CheY-like chemotaxis protein
VPDLAGRRALVVDDVASNRMVAASHLRRLGAEVLEAENGPRALELLRDQPVDLVLLDLSMPGMGGAEALAAIRALPGGLARIPVLAMTAHAATDKALAGIAAAFDGVLHKPLSPARLAEVLLQIFR